MEAESLIFTFYPHPRMVVNSNDLSLRLLNTLNEKIDQLGSTGIDHLVVFPFSKEFAELTYDQFVRTILIGKLNMKALVLGHDHRLGKNREGSFENVLALSEQLGFSMLRIDQFVLEQTNISSSKIRNALQAGDVRLANAYLGYPYLLQGVVTEGNRIGRTIDFPTANVLTRDPYKLIPAEGVYAVKVMIGNELFQGMLNIGYRPTISQNADHRTIEVHIFGFDRDIYNQEITVYFHEKIRNEIKFSSIDALKQQLETDRETAMSLLNQ